MLGLLAGAAVRSLVLAAAVAMGLLLRGTRSPLLSLAAWTLVLAASLSMPAAMRLTSIALPNSIVTVWQLPVAPEPLVRIEASLAPSGGEPGSPASTSAAGVAAREIAWYLYLAVFSALMLRLLWVLLCRGESRGPRRRSPKSGPAASTSAPAVASPRRRRSARSSCCRTITPSGGRPNDRPSSRMRPRMLPGTTSRSNWPPPSIARCSGSIR